MKRILVLVLVFVVCVLLALWSPWLYLKIDFGGLFGIQKPDSIAGLQVFSLSGDIEVFLDNESIGKTNVENSPLISDKVEPGQHLVAIKKLSTTEATYWTFNKLINFEQGASVAISYNIGPEEEFSEGHVIYAVKKANSNDPSKVIMNLNTEDASFIFDSLQPEKVVGNLKEQVLTLDSQHKIKVSKQGFEPSEFTILPDTQEERDKLKTYDIVIDAQLMYQPVVVTN